MASKEGEPAPAAEGTVSEQPASTPAPAPETAPAPEPAPAPATATAPESPENPVSKEEPLPAAEGEATEKSDKPRRPPLTPEEKAQKRAERNAKLREQRNATRQAAKEAKAAGLPPKPKPARAETAVASELKAPEGGVPKISVAKLPAAITVPDFRALFEPYGAVLRADVRRSRGRPTLGTVVYNTHNEVLRAFNALNGKHTCEGAKSPLKIQYSGDSVSLGETLKKTTDAVANCIQEYKYDAGVLKSRNAKDFLNRAVLGRKKPPATELLTAALLVHTKAAKPDDLVGCQLVASAGVVQQFLNDQAAPPAVRPAAASPAASKKEDAKPTKKLDNTFDAVVPFLDKLEQERWNRMAKANLHLNEYRRFRFVDILATPSLELWRWMVEDCRITPAEAATCFAILQNYYGFTK